MKLNSSTVLLFAIALCPWGAFFLPWIATSNIPVTQGIVFQSGVLAALLASINSFPASVNSKNIPFLSMSLYFLISSVIFITTTKEFHLEYILYLGCFMTLPVFYAVFIKSHWMDHVEKYMMYSVAVMLIYGVFQMLGCDQFQYNFDPAITIQKTLCGTLGQASNYGGYLAICQPLFFFGKGDSRRKKILCSLALVLTWVTILMTKSAAGLLVGIMVILYALFAYGKYNIPISFHGIAAAGFFSFSGRIEMWKAMLPSFREHAITGGGIGSLWAKNINIDTTLWTYAHNEYYQVAYEFGVIGLALVLWCIYDALKRYRSNRRMACIFFGYCMLCLFIPAAHVWPISVVGMTAYASLYVL